MAGWDLLFSSHGYLGALVHRRGLRGQHDAVSADARRFCFAERSGHYSAGSKRWVSIVAVVRPTRPRLSLSRRLVLADRVEVASSVWEASWSASLRMRGCFMPSRFGLGSLERDRTNRVAISEGCRLFCPGPGEPWPGL